MVPQEVSKPRRVELILRQIEALPTLPAVATRLLTLTTSPQAHAREVVELVEGDPALTARVLTICRGSIDRARHGEVLGVERAVALLGFNAVRNAVLSLKVFDVFEAQAPAQAPPAQPPRLGGAPASPLAAQAPGGAEHAEHAEPAEPGFDRRGLWIHCLAVGTLAETIARSPGKALGIQGEDAFVCGLLHDVGKLALDHVLPKSFARVVELADLHRGDIAEHERRIMGIDHHTAGKRLAEQWGLPHKLQDCIWFHGTDQDAVPELEHRPLIGLIRLADTLVRRLHLGYSGNHAPGPEPDRLARRLGLDPGALPEATAELPDKLHARAAALGLEDPPSRALFLHALQRANEALGRLNQELDHRAKLAAEQGRILEAIADFHAHARPGRSVEDVLHGVVGSAHRALGPGFYALLHPTRISDPSERAGPVWLLARYDPEGQPLHTQYIDPPAHGPDLAQLDSSQPPGLELMGVLPWIADHLVQAPDLRRLKLLPLPSGWGTAGVLVHDRPGVPAWRRLHPLTGAWGAAIAAAAQHDGARRLGEQLNQANAALALARDRLGRSESMARLGEMAAGAAHEMNNPLAVIAGRSQMLTMMLEGGSRPHAAAQAVQREAHRLSDLITCLRQFADPPRAHKRPTDLGQLLDDTIRHAQATHCRPGQEVDISLTLKHQLPPVHVDADQISQAVAELLANAIQAGPRTGIQVTARLVAPQTPAPENENQRPAIPQPDPGNPGRGAHHAHALRPRPTADGAGGRGATCAEDTLIQRAAAAAGEATSHPVSKANPGGSFADASREISGESSGESSGDTPGGGVMVRVVDDGGGMEPHTLAHALDPFFSARPAGRGVGMGLPRAQQWLQAHGSSLQLHAQPGRGTTVCFTLRLDSAP